MTLERLTGEYSVAKYDTLPSVPTGSAERGRLFSLSVTDREISVAARSDELPSGAKEVSQAWRAFRVAGTLDFALIGILAELTELLKQKSVSVFAVSTFDTDYLLVKEKDAVRAAEAFRAAGHTVEDAK